MTEEQALHTAARRYCLARASYWHQQYAEVRTHRFRPDYSDEANDVVPRYIVLEVILWDVERLRPEQFTSLEDAREWLVLAGMTAQRAVVRPRNGEIEEQSMQEERELFRKFVLGIDCQKLAEIEPLPYRHALTYEESRAQWTRVDAHWKTGLADGFYPITGDPAPGAIAVDANAFQENVTPESLQKIFARHGIARVYELREYGPSDTEYEMDLVLLKPFCKMSESYWTADAMDWLIYASHHSTMTVAGAWLVEAVKEHWPAWAEHQIQWRTVAS